MPSVSAISSAVTRCAGQVDMAEMCQLANLFKLQILLPTKI